MEVRQPGKARSGKPRAPEFGLRVMSLLAWPFRADAAVLGGPGCINQSLLGPAGDGGEIWAAHPLINPRVPRTGRRAGGVRSDPEGTAVLVLISDTSQ